MIYHNNDFCHDSIQAAMKHSEKKLFGVEKNCRQSEGLISSPRVSTSKAFNFQVLI